MHHETVEKAGHKLKVFLEGVNYPPHISLGENCVRMSVKSMNDSDKFPRSFSVDGVEVPIVYTQVDTFYDTPGASADNPGAQI